MKSYRSPEFNELFWKLSKEVRTQTRKAYRQFLKDPFHPSLQFKRLKGSSMWSVRIGSHYRAMGRRVSPDVIGWLWIGSHTEYDKETKLD